jgi:hypothetical protein
MLENRFERDALYFDYSSAANPLLQKIITPIPYQTFSPSFFEGQSSDIMPLDISTTLADFERSSIFRIPLDHFA